MPFFVMVFIIKLGFTKLKENFVIDSDFLLLLTFAV